MRKNNLSIRELNRRQKENEKNRPYVPQRHSSMTAKTTKPKLDIRLALVKGVVWTMQ